MQSLAHAGLIKDCLFPAATLRYRNNMRLLALICALAAASPVLAAATDWQDVAPETRVRLISADQPDANGKILAGLEIDMPPSFKTYWRVPGETGIPITLDLTGSTGIAAHQMLWPYPKIDLSQGFVDFVYYGPTVLPLELTADGQPIDLKLSAIMGICSDICVPVQASFRLMIDPTKPDAGQGVRLAQALANVPLPGDEAAVGEVFATPEGLAVALNSTEIDPASVIAAGPGDSALLFGAPQKSPDKSLVLLPLLGGDETQVVGQTIEITYMTPSGPYVVVRKIAAGST